VKKIYKVIKYVLFPPKMGEGLLFSPVTEISELSKKVTFAVAKLAIEQNFWLPEYHRYKKACITTLKFRLG